MQTMQTTSSEAQAAHSGTCTGLSMPNNPAQITWIMPPISNRLPQVVRSKRLITRPKAPNTNQITNITTRATGVHLT